MSGAVPGPVAEARRLDQAGKGVFGVHPDAIDAFLAGSACCGSGGKCFASGYDVVLPL